ncbi:MAG: hypothetical protein GF313_10955 [Caldithrix sp.]|nr:hypothetical protein [Caldithrix sp.]
MKYTTLLVLFFFLNTSFGIASADQEANLDDDLGWFAFGLGIGLQHDATFMTTANFGRVHSLQLALHESTDITIGDSPDVHSYSIGYCYSSVSRFNRVAFSFGPSWVSGEKREDSIAGLEKFQTIGLFSNWHIIFTPVKEIGLGLNAYMNLNPQQTTGGLSIIFVIEGNK